MTDIGACYVICQLLENLLVDPVFNVLQKLDGDLDDGVDISFGLLDLLGRQFGFDPRDDVFPLSPKLFGVVRGDFLFDEDLDGLQ